MEKTRVQTGRVRVLRNVVLWSTFAVAAIYALGTYSSKMVDGMLAPDEVIAPRTPSEADVLLSTSIRQLESLESLSADVEFESEFFGEKYYGRGRYAQAALPRSFAARRSPFEATRFLLQANLSSSSVEDAKKKARGEGNFLTVVCDCDARAWWRYTSVEGVKTLYRIDIDDLRARLMQLDSDDMEKLRQNGVPNLNCGLDGLPGLGGLAGLLKRVDAYYDLDPEYEKIKSPKGDDLLKITGRVKQKFWDHAKTTLQVAEFEPYLLENIPTNVEIYFGSSRVFPYRIRFYSAYETEGGVKTHEVFAASYEPNSQTITPDDFRFDQPQSTFEHAEGAYIEKLIPGVKL